MIKKYKPSKFIKWITGGVLAVVIIVGGTALYLSAKWKPMLSTVIKEAVHKGSKGLYRVDFKDVHLNLIAGSMVLDSIKLFPDTSMAKQSPAHVFRMRLAHLKLQHVGILNAYFKRKINIKSIILDRPDLDMIYLHGTQKKEQTNDSTLYQLLSKSVKSIRVDNIKIVNANFDYYKGAKKIQSIKHLMVDMRQVLIDSLSQYDTTRVWYAKDLGLELIGYQSITKDKMYKFQVDTMRASISQKTLNVTGLRLVPGYPDLTFSRKYASQKDRYDLNFKQINLSGVDFAGLSADGNLKIKRLNIGPGKAAIFLNRALPPPAIDKGRNYPHVALKRLTIASTIDTISLKDIDIAYTEYNPKTAERGTLKLDNLNGNIRHVSNDSLALTKNAHAYANLSTKLMGVAKMWVKIDFNLLAKDAAFGYTGHIGPFDMKILNPLSKSLGLVAIESGLVKRADFDVQANIRQSKGKVSFQYSNLKVNLLKEGETKEDPKKKGLLSLLANSVLIKNDNPSKGELLRSATINFERVPQASFFNLMWKSVFTGIREIVGIGMVPMKPTPEPKTAQKKKR